MCVCVSGFFRIIRVIRVIGVIRVIRVTNLHCLVWIRFLYVWSY